MSTAISDGLAPCFEAFGAVIRLSKLPDPSYQTYIEAKGWEGELGRLRIWSANIAAHRKGRCSLDYRLRDDFQVRQQVSRLLRRLQSTLSDVTRLLVDGDAIDDGVVQETFDDDNEPEIIQLYEFVSNIIRRLFRMSVFIRKPARSDFIRCGNLDQVMGYLPIDIERIRLKYPNAAEYFVQRLGHAMIQRRKYLDYRRRRHAKFVKGLEDLGDDDAERSPSDTNATGSRPETPTFDPVVPQDAFSVTSFATSFLRGTHHNMPKRPQESAKGRAFECPYCFYVIKTPNAHSWVKHLFTDLRPYICHVKDCSIPDELHDSWHMWLWHIQNRHPGQAEGYCPFCRDKFHGRTWAKHVGLHLLDLALFALPPIDHTAQPDLSDHDDSDNDDSSEDDDDPTSVPAFEPEHGPNYVDKSIYNARLKLPPAGFKSDFNEIRVALMRLGTDWPALPAACPNTDRSQQWLRNWYYGEIRKGSYGAALDQMVQRTDIMKGRESEPIPEAKWGFPCPVDYCSRDYDNLFKLRMHMKNSHTGTPLRHDLYILNEETGKLIKRLNTGAAPRSQEVFSNSKIPSPPSTKPAPTPPDPPTSVSLPLDQGIPQPTLSPPPPPPASTVNLPTIDETIAVPPQDIPPQPTALALPPPPPHLPTKLITHLDTIDSITDRIDYIYSPRVQAYVTAPPADLKARYDEFRFLKEDCLERLAIKLPQLESWDPNEDIESRRLELIDRVDGLLDQLESAVGDEGIGASTGLWSEKPDISPQRSMKVSPEDGATRTMLHEKVARMYGDGAGDLSPPRQHNE